MTTALERKRRAQRRLRTYRRTAMVVAALAPPALLAVAAYSPLCDVDTVRVSGTRRVSAATVVAAAGVRDGAPLMSVDVSAVRRRVLAVPGVKSASVIRSWPSAVSVRVVERVPVVAVPRGGVVDLYDADGVYVASPLTVPGVLPVLAVAAGAPTPEAIDAAVGLLRALPPSLRVRDLRADGVALSFRLTDGAEVVWGSGEHTVEKVRALTLLVRQHAKRYDIRVPDHPAVVPR